MKIKSIIKRLPALLVIFFSFKAGAVVVNTTSDSDGTGDCSVTCTLRDAINNVEEGGTITFSADGNFFIDPAYGELVISDKSFTVQGNGSDVTIIDGGDDITSPSSGSNIFDIEANSTITFQDLTIQNGADGAIFTSYSYVFFDHVNITNNKIGVVYAYYSEVSFSYSEITDNTVDSTVISGAYSKIMLDHSNISQNIQESGPTTHYSSSGDEFTVTGGIIYSNYSKLEILDSTISNNTGLGISINNGMASILNTAIFNNFLSIFTETYDESTGTVDYDGIYTQGGGIYISNSESVEIKNSAIYANKADVGGGIYINDDSTVNLDNVTVSGNEADDYAGGIFIDGSSDVSFSYCTIAFNSSGGYGGGFYALDATVTSEWSIFSNNESVYEIGDECTSYGTAFLNSNGYNFVPSSGSESCAFESTETDITEGNADLQPLADNGGSVSTHALGDSSILRDIASCDEVGDGRDLKRDSLCDIGAFEYGATEVVTAGSGGSGGTPTSGTPSDTDPASGTGVGGGPSGESMFESGSPTSGAGGCSLILTIN